MYSIAKAFLDYLETADVKNDPEWEQFHFPAPAEAFLNRVYEHDIWNGDFRKEFDTIRTKKVRDLTVPELYTYFTAIVCTERTYSGFFYEQSANGTLKALLEQYIQLCNTEGSIPNDHLHPER